MRGHIQQRGRQSWRVKVFVGRDADGVMWYFERTVRGTRRDAERELARVVLEVGEGRHAAAAPMSFAELLDRRAWTISVEHADAAGERTRDDLRAAVRATFDALGVDGHLE